MTDMSKEGSIVLFLYFEGFKVWQFYSEWVNWQAHICSLALSIIVIIYATIIQILSLNW